MLPVWFASHRRVNITSSKILNIHGCSFGSHNRMYRRVIEPSPLKSAHGLPNVLIRQNFVFSKNPSLHSLVQVNNFPRYISRLRKPDEAVTHHSTGISFDAHHKEDKRYKTYSNAESSLFGNFWSWIIGVHPRCTNY